MADDELVISTPNLDAFIAIHKNDDDCLALGLHVLVPAWNEANEAGLLGWSEQIHEFVVALRDGKGLNRPLGGSWRGR
jgi:hypothetical protein